MFALRTLALLIFLGVFGAAPAMARQAPDTDGDRILSSGALDAAVAEHTLTADGQRARLAEFLARTDVQDLARERGIDWTRVTAAAASLSDAEVMEIAPLVAQASRFRLGTVTISVAALIILLLILVVVT